MKRVLVAPVWSGEDASVIRRPRSKLSHWRSWDVRFIVDDVRAARLLLLREGLAGALLVDQIDDRRLVLILELLGLEMPRLLVHNVLGEIEHVLRDFDVLDVVEIWSLGTNFVGIAQHVRAIHTPVLSQDF